jgi:hypothetical protein
MPISGAHGEYVEPHEGVLRDLQMRDMWEDRQYREMRERDEREDAAAARLEEHQDSERRGEMLDRVRSSQRLSVTF